MQGSSCETVIALTAGPGKLSGLSSGEGAISTHHSPCLTVFSVASYYLSLVVLVLVLSRIQNPEAQFK